MSEVDQKALIDRQKSFADEILWRAMSMMQEQSLPAEIIIDRILTSGAAHVVKAVGEKEASKLFLHIAAQIDGGAFARIAAPTKIH